MTYKLNTQYDSPNYGGSGYAPITLPVDTVVVHWWGTPSGQTHDAIRNWLCNPESEVSSHVVISPGEVSCIVNYDSVSWANGNTWANQNTLTAECDPNNVNATIPTLAEWIADMVREGNLSRNFRVTGHKDWHTTSCPGLYYPRLAEIKALAESHLTGEPAPAPTASELPAWDGNHVDLPAWNLPAGEFYGNIDGGYDSHGGFYASERPFIRQIQRWLMAHGYAQTTDDRWADGIYEQPTIDAVRRFQQTERPNSTDRWGEVWQDDYATMQANN